MVTLNIFKTQIDKFCLMVQQNSCYLDNHVNNYFTKGHKQILGVHKTDEKGYICQWSTSQQGNGNYNVA